MNCAVHVYSAQVFFLCPESLYKLRTFFCVCGYNLFFGQENATGNTLETSIQTAFGHLQIFNFVFFGSPTFVRWVTTF